MTRAIMGEMKTTHELKDVPATASMAFEPRPMAARKEAFYAFARRNVRRVFAPDGTLQPETVDDSRVPLWLYPALVSSPEPPQREFANVIYGAAKAWAGRNHLTGRRSRGGAWDVFNTSLIAANLARHRGQMTDELIQRSEEHLDRYVVRKSRRFASSGSNDHMFQGYNDNMPAMCVRAMLLAGQILNRDDYIDHGLFFLEGLCAHFQRRGLLSEHTSGTYAAVTLTALMDVAELCTHAAAREMAIASANRILLDIFGHWHRGTGAIGGAQARAYTGDLTETFSQINTLMWYFTGDPLCIHPMAALESADWFEVLGPGQLAPCSSAAREKADPFEGFMGHGRNFGHSLAQKAELFSPNYRVLSRSGESVVFNVDAASHRVQSRPSGADAASTSPPPTVLPGIRDFARAPREYPYEIYATSDVGQMGPFDGVKEIQTRAFHQPLYALATTSDTYSGHPATLHAVLARVGKPQSWKDHVTVWHKTINGAPDQGDLKRVHGGKMGEEGNVEDVGRYHCLQKGGSALVLGALGPALLDKDVSTLKFSLIFGTFLHLPDEIVEKNDWHFLRFGEVYVGVRMAAMVQEKKMRARRVIKNKYLRIEAPLIENRTVTVDQQLREWMDYGYVFEIASRKECDLFATFCRECLACQWEFYHCAYRNSRYQGRHGELQIIDSVAAGTIRFMAIDGEVEPRVKLAATGLNPKLTQLFPAGRQIKQRRLTYWPDFIGMPLENYAGNEEPLLEHIVVADWPGERRRKEGENG